MPKILKNYRPLYRIFIGILTTGLRVKMDLFIHLLVISKAILSLCDVQACRLVSGNKQVAQLCNLN